MRHFWTAQSRNGYTAIDEYNQDGCAHGAIIITKTRKLGQEVEYLANNAYQYGVQDTIANLVRWGFLDESRELDIKARLGTIDTDKG